MTKQITPVVVQISARRVLEDSVYNRLHLATRAEGFSRRRWFDELAATIYSFPGLIIDEFGCTVPCPDVDEIMGHPSGRWLSYYLAVDTNGHPKRDCRRSVKRLQLFDLYFAIRHPERSRLIRK